MILGDTYKKYFLYLGSISILGEISSPLDSYTDIYEWFWAIFLYVKWQVILGDTYETMSFENFSAMEGLRTLHSYTVVFE